MANQKETPQMPRQKAEPLASSSINSQTREEEIGYHKGAITTLINERNELIRIVHTVDAIMQAHLKRLEELGVKVKK